MKYCRRCDLAFCDRHESDHPDLEGHELVERSDLDLFCCICLDIYRPTRKESTP
jgi:uncharacterized radical SAM superfamily Fe-S cluster-containing enzyme